MLCIPFSESINYSFLFVQIQFFLWLWRQRHRMAFLFHSLFIHRMVYFGHQWMKPNAIHLLNESFQLSIRDAFQIDFLIAHQNIEINDCFCLNRKVSCMFYFFVVSCMVHPASRIMFISLALLRVMLSSWVFIACCQCDVLKYHKNHFTSDSFYRLVI